MQQGGVTAGDQKVTDIAAVFTPADFTDGALILRKGKKSYHKLLLG